MTEREAPREDVIDLGQASIETKGGNGQVLDSAFSLQPNIGLSDD